MSGISNIETVPGRACGECNYCCQHLLIDSEDLRVSPGTLCRNWKTGTGCTIYETRPQVCRGYLCGWMMFGHFDDSWRPDQCGIIVTPTGNNIPENYPAEGIEFLIVKPDLAAQKQDFLPFLFSAIRAGMPLFLALRGPAGHGSSRAFLNAKLGEVAKNNDQAAFRAGFLSIFETLKAGPFKPAIFRG